MSLNMRFLLISLCLILASSMASWSAISRFAEDLIEEWAVLYAEKQVLYDRQRTLQPIIREIALSKQLAQSSNLIAFADQPYDTELRQRALQELENYRFNFLEMNYFIALYKSGEYFHNDANNTYQGQQLRYILNPDNPDDVWFYQQIRQERDLFINVNSDAALDVTKVWINLLIKDGQDTLGIVGTGLNLGDIVQKMQQDANKGITNIFVNHTGAIQLHPNKELINLSSFTKSNSSLHHVNQLLNSEQDKALLQQAMDKARSKTDAVISHYINFAGTRSLLAVAYLPEIDWYEITLIDTTAILPLSRFSTIFIVYGITLLALMVLFNLALRLVVLRPIRQLITAAEQIEHGQPIRHLRQRTGEIGKLLQQFSRMAASIQNAQTKLERQVQEQTLALDNTARTDLLTQCLNRSGMLQILESQIQHPQALFSLIWLDIDFFKEINDRYGYQQADKALLAVARIIQQCIDEENLGVSARWGSDEFLACIWDPQPANLQRLCENLRLKIDNLQPDYAIGTLQSIPLTVSIGVYTPRPEEPLSDILRHTASALSQAKSSGRNTVRFFTKPSADVGL